jgi:TatD DNase family protein
MKIIDTHAHLDMKQFNKDLASVLVQGEEAGVKEIIIPAVNNKTKKIIELVDQHENIYFGSGCHPNYTDDFDDDLIKKLAGHEKCIAIGECGLDWYRIPKGSNIEYIKEKQKYVFRKQIELSIELNKPLILHSRDTDYDMIQVLSEYNCQIPGGVIHCYVGSEKLLQLVDQNFYFGIGGILTYGSAKELRENVKKIPLDRLVLETDAPYLTPRKIKGSPKRNEPAFLTTVLKELSIILNINKEKLAKICYENTKKLFFKEKI